MIRRAVKAAQDATDDLDKAAFCFSCISQLENRLIKLLCDIENSIAVLLV